MEKRHKSVPWSVRDRVFIYIYIYILPVPGSDCRLWCVVSCIDRVSCVVCRVSCGTFWPGAQRYAELARAGGRPPQRPAVGELTPAW